MTVKVQEGNYYLYAPWGGKCIAHFEKGCLWMHRYIGPYAYGDTGAGIWNCPSARDSEKLINGVSPGEDAVWVLWDNQDWKKMAYNADTGDFYVQHGPAWHPFWSVDVRKERDVSTASNSEIEDKISEGTDNNVMMVDSDGSATRGETTNDLLSARMEVNHVVGRKRCSFGDSTSSTLNSNRKRFKS
mmetsp:Transcript_22455/g.33261  ORF Transcript_22455/g.33261 Transcript_22455/m.33261 type:complete len:187 (+) Transcript_22455:44-604(+)